MNLKNFDLMHMRMPILTKIKKWWHDKRLQKKEFQEGDLVLLFNSRLKLFQGKLKSQWSGPFRITQVFPYGIIELVNKANEDFKVNWQRLKPYFVEEARLKSVFCTLMDSTP